MAIINVNTVGGKWLDKRTLKNGDVLKLTTEATESTSQQGGKQVVAKAVVKGGDTEAKNISINKPSQRAMVEAFGADSVEWIDKQVAVKVMDTLVSGKIGVAMYLIPEGYETAVDTGGFMVVRKIGESHEAGDIDPADIPF